MAKRFKNAKMQEMYLKAVERSEEMAYPVARREETAHNTRLIRTLGLSYTSLAGLPLRCRVSHEFEDGTRTESILWTFSGHAVSEKKVIWLLEESEKTQQSEPVVR